MLFSGDSLARLVELLVGLAVFVLAVGLGLALAEFFQRPHVAIGRHERLATAVDLDCQALTAALQLGGLSPQHRGIVLGVHKTREIELARPDGRAMLLLQLVLLRIQGRKLFFKLCIGALDLGQLLAAVVASRLAKLKQRCHPKLKWGH